MNNKGSKKPPVRTCISCRREFDKKDLIRIVRSPEGEVTVDLTGKKNGRGAYICKSPECAAKCAKGLLKKHLNCEIPLQIYEELQNLSRGER